MQVAEIEVEYRDHMGDDLMVVNAARASFGKESEWEYSCTGMDEEFVPEFHRHLSTKDRNLLRFLASGFRTQEWEKLVATFLHAENPDAVGLLLREYKSKAQHWAPFAHPHMQIRMKLPLFLARQFVKHQVGGVWSEESRRYIDAEPEFWFPKVWHTRPDDIKQGAAGEVPEQYQCVQISMESTQFALASYKMLLSRKVAPEEARIVLPLNMMTTVVWTGSLLFWSRVANQLLFFPLTI